MNKREKIKSKKITDVLLSSDTTEVQGFLQEGGDDCALVVFRDEEDEDEMEGTGIPWVVIGEAVGAEEQLERRRSGRVREARELYEGEEFSSEEKSMSLMRMRMSEGGKGALMNCCCMPCCVLCDCVNPGGV